MGYLLEVDCAGCEYPALLSLSTPDLRKIEHIMMEYSGRRNELVDVFASGWLLVHLKDETHKYANRSHPSEGTRATHRE